MRSISDCAVNRDARKYMTMYNSLCRFDICAICGNEGSSKGFVSVVKCKSQLLKSGISRLYESLLLERSDVYDDIFSSQLKAYFEDGLLRNVKNICKECCNQLPKKKMCPATSDSLLACNFANSNLDVLNLTTTENYTEVSNTRNEYPYVPKLALVRGMFTGSVPMELTGLTYIEQSMISIYSAISKITIIGGKHYFTKGACTYTVINDLASVAVQLPRMPTLECTSILRHKHGLVKKDYKYRPKIVYCALRWLKTNNHLYADIEIVFPDGDWENNNDEVDIPYIDLSKDDIDTIDESNEITLDSSESVSTNPGKDFY